VSSDDEFEVDPETIAAQLAAAAEQFEMAAEAAERADPEQIDEASIEVLEALARALSRLPDGTPPPEGTDQAEVATRVWKQGAQDAEKALALLSDVPRLLIRAMDEGLLPVSLADLADGVLSSGVPVDLLDTVAQSTTLADLLARRARAAFRLVTALDTKGWLT